MFKIPFFSKREKKEKKEEKPVYVFEESMSPNSLANKAYSHIEKLASFGPRPAASKTSRMVANNIASILEGFCDEVEFKSCKIDRNRTSFWVKVVSVLLPFCSVFLFIGLPYLSFMLALSALVLCYCEGLEAMGLFSRFFKKEEGESVFSIIRSKEEEERVIILSSHHDSAPLYKRKERVRDIYLPLFSIAYITVLALFLMLYEVLKGCFLRFNLPSLFPLIFILIAFALSVLSLRFFSLFSSEYSPGVGDNLSGVGVALAVAEYFSKKRLKRTRLEILSFDGEECGCQGSRAYYEASHYPDGTININIDGIFSSEDLAVLTNDGNGLVKLDEALSSALSNIAKTQGYKIKSGKLSLFSGATDASSAARHGIRAVTITSMAEQGSEIAHTKNDTIENVEMKALEEVISILLKFIETEDGKTEREEGVVKSLLDGRKYRLSLHD